MYLKLYNGNKTTLNIDSGNGKKYLYQEYNEN